MKFAQPAWLILLVLLPLLGVGAILVSQLRKKQWAAFVASRLRSSLVKRSSSLPRWFALFFLLSACAGMIGALSRPQGDAGTRAEKTIGRNVLIALDLSRSMRVKDVKPDRLTQAKVVIYELLEALPNDRVGLIGFAGDAYVYAPLTVDHAAVRETVEQIDENWAPRGGSNLADAVDLATQTLRNTGQKNNALVILSDGEKHEGDIEDMISEAEHSGVYILAVGVGTEDGNYVPNGDFQDGRMVDPKGKLVISRLQPEVMRRLAVETKGRYALAGSGVDIPAMVKSAIKDLDAFEMQGRERRVSIEFYQWLLLPAILFLIVSIVSGTRWRGVATRAAVVGSIVLFTPRGASADEVSRARSLLDEGNFKSARNAYHKLAEESFFTGRKARFKLGEATAAYREGFFKEARSAYSGALLSDDPEVRANAHAGLGNSLFQLGWRNLTDEAYPSDPDKLPDLASFDDLVRDRLARLQQTAKPSEGDPTGYARMESLVTNWTDAVRHYDSAIRGNPADTMAKSNRDMTMVFLKRLRELMEEDKQETEQSIPPPQQGQGDPQPEQGQGDPQDQKQPGEQGDKDKQSQGQGEGEEEKSDDGSGGKKQDPQQGKDKSKDDSTDKSGSSQDETPEEHARRQLKDNADSEKGPPMPGRREFRPPEKDW